MAKSGIRINAHAHVLPYPHEFPAFMKYKKILWISDDNQFMCQDNWSRPVTHPSFFLHEKIEWMKKNNIDHEVVITLSQLYGNGMDPRLYRDVMQFQNDYQANLQSNHPDLFTSGFVVQPAYIDMALKEIERCVHSLHLSVLCLPTHFKTSTGEWKTVADSSVFPIFEYANELGIAIEFHPYDAENMIQLQDQFWRFHLIWMCAQTADLFHVFSALDLAFKYPKIRFCFAHGNQFGQMGYGRRVQGFKGRPDLFTGGADPRKNITSSNVYFDTLVHDVLSFELLLKRQGVSQIVAGLDDPYPLGEMDEIEDSYPGKVIEEAVLASVINEQQAGQIWNKNVCHWLGFNPLTKK